MQNYRRKITDISFVTDTIRYTEIPALKRLYNLRYRYYRYRRYIVDNLNIIDPSL